MITFFYCYLIIGVTIASISIWAINTFGIDYLLKDKDYEIDIDFNKFSIQIIFILVVILLWPIIFFYKNDE